MSIRDDFEGLWNRGEYDVSELLDLYAHELAENLRDLVGRHDYPGENDYAVAFVAGYRSAAKAIDPFKETE